MLDKDYYQLEDLKQRFNLTESDVHYLIAEKNVPPCFYMPKTTFIIGGWQRNGFIGFANVNYEGLVAIPQSNIQELVNKRKVLPYHFSLLNKAKISQIDNKYDFKIPLPNDYIQGWKSKDLSDISWPTIPAKLYPYAVPTLKHTFKALLMTFAKDETDRAVTAEKFNHSFGETPKEELRPTYKTFLFSEVCIRHSDLISLGILSKKHGARESKLLADDQEFDGNAFEKVLAKILCSDKSLSAKPIFKILVNECNLDEDSRRFDTGGILLEHVDGVILWKDVLSKAQEKKCSLSTLGNKLTKVRGLLAKTGRTS